MDEYTLSDFESDLRQYKNAKNYIEYYHELQKKVGYDVTDIDYWEDVEREIKQRLTGYLPKLHKLLDIDT